MAPTQQSHDSLRHRLRQLLAVHWPLALALLIGLAFRLALWGKLPRTGFISDEGEYLSAASWLAQGRGFAWYLGYLWTRAPLYPLFLALHLRLFGDSLLWVMITQTALSLLNVALVYGLALRLRPLSQARIVPFLAALLMAIYLPFAIYPQTLLSETLYIALMLSAFLVMVGHHKRPYWSLVVAGALFGLATLTRSLTLGFLPCVALWLLFRALVPQPRPTGLQLWRWIGLRARPAVAFSLAALLVILPWTVYNSRLYGGTVIIDTSGAFNLMLGARTAYDGQRSDAPSRNFVLALLDKQLTPEQRKALLAEQAPREASCLLRAQNPRLLAALERPVGEALPQAQVQNLMSAEGICLIRERPWAFVQKSLGEFLDFFQINYSGDERFTDNFTLGRLPPWYSLALFLLDDTLYVVTLPLTVLGFALAWRQIRTAGWWRSLADDLMLVGGWLAFTVLVAPLLFAINRFRLPLLPFAFLLAAYAVTQIPSAWRVLLRREEALWSGMALLLLLIAATPYAYFLPHEADGSSRFASYLGPAPSSLNSTLRALAGRPNWLHAEQLQAAFHSGDAAAAQRVLASGSVMIPRSRNSQISNDELFRALQDGLNENAAAGAESLPFETITRTRDVEAAVVRGDLLRSAGQLDEARMVLGGSAATGFVDDANPVEWAWNWLHPAVTKRIDLASDLDLGYINGCFLGEGDTSIDPPATFRWCTDGTQLRFPAAGSGAPQTLSLRVDGRGWPQDMLPIPAVQVWLNDQEIGSFVPDHTEPRAFTIDLPATPAGEDVIITLHSASFVPDAARYVSQQGSQVGQVQRLAIRLDWAELQP